MKYLNYTRLKTKTDINKLYIRKVIFITILISIVLILLYENNTGILSFQGIINFFKLS